MRLIKVEKVEDLKFKEFGADAELPRYAILSHTWGDPDTEVTFEELQSLSLPETDENDKTRVRGKAGFSKIENACREARTDGYKYLWVDTCCIRKTTSEETEAVNSMFRWYRGAKVCYAYLNDVALSKVEDDGNHDLVTKPELSSARWFARGWTVMELIAPVKVEFFDKNWKFLGTRKTLKTMLSNITKINEAVLADTKKLKKTTIAQRMSWMVGRKTFKDEDVVYSMLGIFDVNMNTIYGEGKDKAFNRLQKKLAKEFANKDDDQTLYAWQPSQPLHPNRPEDTVKGTRIRPMKSTKDGLSMYASDYADYVFKGSKGIVSAPQISSNEVQVKDTTIKSLIWEVSDLKEIFIAVLASRPEAGSESQLAVVLQKHASGGYVRHNTAPLLTYQPSRPAEKAYIIPIHGGKII